MTGTIHGTSTRDSGADLDSVHQLWTQWEDNHDGYGEPFLFSPEKIFSVVNGAQCYGNILREPSHETQAFTR